MFKKVSITVCLALICSVFAFADPVEGFWKSIDDKTGKVTAYWNIYQRNNQLFGEIVYLPEEEDQNILADKVKASYRGFPLAGQVNRMKVIGTPWIFGLARKADGEWADGNIIDPESGTMYKCKITFRPMDGRRYSEDTLEMRGEIGLGIGRSQYWVRAKESDWQ